MASTRKTVTVSRQSVQALEEPRFLIQHDGKLYLTLAVLEYDPDHPELTDDQRAVIGELQEMHAAAAPTPAVHMASLELTSTIVTANSVGPGTDGGDGTV